MTIRADVIVGSRANVLMIPVTAVFNNQGSRVVYVAGATGTEMRTVDVGESNDRMVEIVSGLREGERVSLSAPAPAPAAAGQAAPPRGNALQPR
jgi:multidrug efflux pump subunit AcrA (membrane-fusion protein)